MTPTNSLQLLKKIETMEIDEAIEALLSILKSSEEWEIKEKAVELLIRFDDPEKKRFQLLKNVFLNDRHPQLRLKVIELFTFCYKKDGIVFLKEQYKNCKDGAVRRNLIEMVGKIDLENSIPFLIEALGDTNIESKKSAINFLGKTRTNEAIVPLIKLLHFRNSEIRNDLISSIVKLGKKGDMDVINKYINSEDSAIKREIPVILGKIGNQTSENLLITNLKDENPIVRKNSVKALEKIIELKNVKHILDILNDPDVEARKKQFEF
ncbi:hypothetical protein LCGC14_0623170 [marine sediment metagenome]|uniref:HEAT repeat domain-containing protein n=1 Tax=marine sediment metagenome TaxID=412755 RepID=A0A0F9R493_9ZZZZ